MSFRPRHHRTDVVILPGGDFSPRTDAIHEAFLDESVTRAFLHSHSCTGNPLACRTALATLDIFAQDDVIAVNRQKAAKISA